MPKTIKSNLRKVIYHMQKYLSDRKAAGLESIPLNNITDLVVNMTDNIQDSQLGRGYRLMYSAETWQDARKTCADSGGKLAVPKSQYEFNVVQGLVRKMHYPSIRGCTGSILLAWLGISNANDSVWRNVDGEDIENTDFSTWAKGNGDKSRDPNEPHCVVVDAVNPGLRSYWCHFKQPFVCEFEEPKKNVI